MEFSSPEANARFSPYSPELCCSFLSFSNSFAHFSESEASLADHFKGSAPCSARNLLWASRHSFWNLFGMIALIVYELLMKSPEKKKAKNKNNKKAKLKVTLSTWITWAQLVWIGEFRLYDTRWLQREIGDWGLFLESPETFRPHFEWHNSLCILKTKASRGTKRCSYFYFYFLHNM